MCCIEGEAERQEKKEKKAWKNKTKREGERISRIETIACNTKTNHLKTNSHEKE